MAQFNLPQGPYGAQQMEIARRQKLAQMLQEQSMQPLQSAPSGAFAAPISPLQVAGKLTQGYMGQKREQEALQQQQELQQRMQQERAAALAKALQASQGQPMQMDAADNVQTPAMQPDPSRGMAALAQSGDPALMQLGAPALQMQQQQQMAETNRRHQEEMARLQAQLRPKPNPQILQTAQGPMTLQDGQAQPIPGPGGMPVQAPNKEPLVTVDMKGENKYAETVGTKSGERDIGQHDAAMSAVENINKLNLTLDQIKNSQAITGMGSEVLKNVERAKALFLQSKAAGNKVSDTELLDSLLGSDVFPMIKALGIGARGLDTPAEREFLRAVMTGTTPMNRQTLIRMTEIRKDVAERAVKRWNERVDSGELDRYFKASGMPKQKIEIPKAQTGLSPEEQAELDMLRKRFGR